MHIHTYATIIIREEETRENGWLEGVGQRGLRIGWREERKGN